MKHKNSHLLVGYWSRLRKGREVPDQTDIDPRAIKRLLSYTFILDYANPARPVYRLAGTALCDGGLMIDMSLRRGVHVDPAHRVLRAEAGATWGDVDHEAQPVGLVVPGGIVSNTGVAGFTLGGGSSGIRSRSRPPPAGRPPRPSPRPRRCARPRPGSGPAALPCAPGCAARPSQGALSAAGGLAGRSRLAQFRFGRSAPDDGPGRHPLARSGQRGS